MVVLSCCPDDSGKDPQNIVTTIAGYVARDEQWTEFERAVEPIFAIKTLWIIGGADFLCGVEKPLLSLRVGELRPALFGRAAFRLCHSVSHNSAPPRKSGTKKHRCDLI